MILQFVTPPVDTVNQTLNAQSVNSCVVLFAHKKSHYYTLSGLDVYDLERDARNYCGTLPVVAHPPCRGWGRLRAFAKPRPDELELGRFAVSEVRRVGGVLEHPSGSALWEDQSLPGGKSVDSFGGFTLKVDQSHWGHKAQKATWLYVCGCSRRDVPQLPLSFDCIEYAVSSSARLGGRRLKELDKSLREITPPDFCTWLVELAKRCKIC